MIPDNEHILKETISRCTSIRSAIRSLNAGKCWSTDYYTLRTLVEKYSIDISHFTRKQSPLGLLRKSRESNTKASKRRKENRPLTILLDTRAWDRRNNTENDLDVKFIEETIEFGGLRS